MREKLPSLFPGGLHDKVLVCGGGTAESLPYLYPHETGWTPTSRCSQRLTIALRQEGGIALFAIVVGAVVVDIFVF